MASFLTISIDRFIRAFAASVICLALLGHCTRAEDEPGFHVRTFAIKNARLVTAPGQLVETGNLVVRSGRIVAVGPGVEIPADADIIEGDGLTVYPGFVDAGATTLLDDSKPVPVEGRRVNWRHAAPQPLTASELSHDEMASSLVRQ